MSPEYEFIHTDNQKICSVADVVSKLREHEQNMLDMGLVHTSGLVVGCFDVLHFGHIEFLRQAKKVSSNWEYKDYGSRIDTLIVGVDRDESVALKGFGRPVFDLKFRCEMLAELVSVDLIFPIPFVLDEYAASNRNVSLFEALTHQIEPDVLITNEITDQFWQEKIERAKKLGIEYVGLKVERPTSSSEVAEKIQKL
jgi:cytidyltransferase-like protein